MFAILFAALLITGAIAVPVPQEEVDREWQAFKDQFRSGANLYVSEEEEANRRTIFEETYRKIAQHNSEAEQGLQTYLMGVNQFSDLTTEEWEKQWLTHIIPSNATVDTVFDNTEIPTSVDWRSKGLVAGVKNQQQCGSCWAFAAIAALEGQYAKKHGRILTLSEQNILDCNHQTDCQRGGNYDMAYNTITREGGIESEQDYPYTSGSGRIGNCRFQKSMSKTNIQRFSTISGETGIAQSVANVGPVGIYMDASGNFQHYRSGIYTGPCSSTQLNHAVTAVGYGSNYFIVRNSWGTGWGNQGYFQIARGRNMCGIGTQGAWPTGVQ